MIRGIMADSPSGDAQAEEHIGRVLARRYKIVKRLGEGGIGAVYRGEDVMLRTPVAIKMLKKEVAEDPEVLARFEREAKTMTALAHENIVQALNFGKTPEGEIILVMELVEGESLRSVIRAKRPFSVELTTPIVTQMGAALMRAHAMGVVHRDLKPENVMVRWDEQQRPLIKVLDFGMARIVSGAFGPSSPLTRKGAVFGTPQYISPEQAMGQPVDARGDQYAFGVMVYEMLAGKRPFDAATPLDLLQLQIHQPPPMVEAIAPHVPQGTGLVIAKMLAKKPDERYADVAQSVEALLAVWGLAPRASMVPNEPAKAGEPPRKWWEFFKGAKK
jgi:serine/threonine-protein kinase